jgi:biopolymer transport protein TolR
MAINVGPGRRGGAIADINVTPMADVMIVLLIIFMVATPIIAGSPVRLPDAMHAAAHSREGRVEIVVRADGVVLLEGSPVNVSEVPERLAAHGSSLPALTVEADRGASYDDVARVLAACRRAGAAEIALGTRPRLAR